MNRKISVLLPVRDQTEFLPVSLESILSQTYGNFEVIIIDDGSIEDVDSIVNQYIRDSRIRYYKNEKNIGAAKTVNRAMSLAKGNVFARQDTDDISKPTRFEIQIELFKEGYHFVVPKCEVIDINGKKKSLHRHDWFTQSNEATPEFIKKNILKQNYIVGGSAMFSRKIFEKIGYHDTSPCSPDYNYWIRILNHFDLGKVDEILYSHRRHPGSWRTRTGRTKLNYHDTAIIRAKKFPILKEPENEHL